MIKRMEPLAKENEKLKEAVNASETKTSRGPGANETLQSPMRGT